MDRFGPLFSIIRILVHDFALAILWSGSEIDVNLLNQSSAAIRVLALEDVSSPHSPRHPLYPLSALG